MRHLSSVSAIIVLASPVPGLPTSLFYEHCLSVFISHCVPPTLLSNTLSYRFLVTVGLIIISSDALEILVIGPVYFLVYYTHRVSASD